jgi:hypothetical protein
METKSFVKVLRKIIREEVRVAIREELAGNISEQRSHKNTITHGMQLHKIASKSAAASPKKRQLVKDPLLNDILNETAAMPADEWSTIDYRSEMARAYAPQNSQHAPSIPHGVDGDMLDMNKDGAEAVAAALTRDYSSLMKAINKKSK